MANSLKNVTIPLTGSLNMNRKGFSKPVLTKGMKPLEIPINANINTWDEGQSYFSVWVNANDNMNWVEE